MPRRVSTGAPPCIRVAFREAMARRRYRQCKVCGAGVPFVTISSRGLCPEHITQRLTSNITAMVTHSGPEFDRWREAMARCVGGRLVDADRAES